MFCTGCVVMVYQLCLRWFGRERLDGLMTTAQVLISVGAVLSGQILPQMLSRFYVVGNPKVIPWWIALLPPAWFAGFDDAIAGSHALFSWLLAALGVVATAAVLWLSFGVLARDYELGLQALNETTSTPKKAKSGRRWLERFVELPLVRSWLSDPVSRASFLLTSAYLIRDRDVKLRVYPAIAPIMVMPLFMVMNPANRGSGGGEFGTGICRRLCRFSADVGAQHVAVFPAVAGCRYFPRCSNCRPGADQPWRSPRRDVFSRHARADWLCGARLANTKRQSQLTAPAAGCRRHARLLDHAEPGGIGASLSTD